MILTFSKLPADRQFFDLSLWPAPLANVFVRLLHRRLAIRPEWFVLLSLASGIALSGFLLVHNTHRGILLLLIFCRAFFDNVDGMWARATHTVSTLGGLLDLTTDMVCNILLLLSLGYRLFHATGSFSAIPLTLLAFLLMHLSMTYYSLHYFLYQHEGSLPDSRFVEGDWKDVLRPLVRIYRLSWRLLALVVLRLPRPSAPPTRRFLSGLSIFGLGSHFLYLAVCVLFFKAQDLIYAELALGAVFSGFLVLQKNFPVHPSGTDKS